MDMLLRILIQYTVPPVLGAIIGYVTNKIAIQMLFRPYHAKYIFGIRIPFTPGILPQRRKEFSRSLARLVGTKLLTAEVLMDHLQNLSERSDIVRKSHKLFSPEFWEEDNFRRLLLPYDERIQSFVQKVQQWLQQHEEEVSGALSDFLTSLTLSEHTVKKLDDLVTVLKKEALAPAIHRYFKNTTVADLGTLFSLEEWHKILSRIGYALCQWLQTEDMHADLVRIGRRLLRKIVDGLSAFRRILVTSSRYIEELEENMPTTVNLCITELYTHLSDPATAAILQEKASVPQSVDQWMHSHNMDSKSISQSLAGKIAQLVRKRLHSDTLGDLLSPAVIQSLVHHGMEWVTHASWKPLLYKIPSRVFGWISTRPPEEGVQKSREYVMRLVKSLFPPLWKFLDIPTIVQKWVDKLPIEQTEHLLLEIISRHLKWINVFGAFLGATIGGLQVLLRVIFP